LCGGVGVKSPKKKGRLTEKKVRIHPVTVFVSTASCRIKIKEEKDQGGGAGLTGQRRRKKGHCSLRNKKARGFHLGSRAK